MVNCEIAVQLDRDSFLNGQDDVRYRIKINGAQKILEERSDISDVALVRLRVSGL